MYEFFRVIRDIRVKTFVLKESYNAACNGGVVFLMYNPQHRQGVLMKKSIFILLVIISIFIASCAPQVTVTSAARVTVTLPAATQTPEPSATPTAVYTPTLAQQAIDIGGNLSVVLGEKVDGGTVIDDFVAPSEWTSKQQVEALLQFDDTELGFSEDDNQWVYIPTEDGKYRVVLQNIVDPSIEVAEMGISEVVWDWPNVKYSILNVGELVEMRGGMPADRDAAHAAYARLTRAFFEQTLVKKVGKDIAYYLITKDGREGVSMAFHVYGEASETIEAQTRGVMIFLSSDGVTVKSFFAKNVDLKD